MRIFPWLALVALGLLGAEACHGTGGGEGASCPVGPQDCSYTNPCPQGSFCLSGDPCGDDSICSPLPDACTAKPTCACIVASSPKMSDLSCSGDATTGFGVVQEDGSTDCCP